MRLFPKWSRGALAVLLIGVFVLASAAPALADSPYRPSVGSKTRRALMNSARVKSAEPSTTKYKVYELWVYRRWAVGNMVIVGQDTPHTRYSFENNIYVWKKKNGSWRLVQHIVGDVGETTQTDEQIRSGYIKMYKAEMKKLGVPSILRYKLKYK